jgi:hypothetical protein
MKNAKRNNHVVTCMLPKRRQKELSKHTAAMMNQLSGTIKLYCTHLKGVNNNQKSQK